MRLTEYVLKSLALRQQFQSSNRLLAFALEAARGAATMALVLSVADAANFGIVDDGPMRRLGFIGIWALLMAGVEAMRAPVAVRDAPS
jgi:hypothetical protein